MSETDDGPCGAVSTGIESLDELLAAVASEGGVKLNLRAESLQEEVGDDMVKVRKLEAYNAQLRSKPECCHFSCDHCGTSISNHCKTSTRTCGDSLGVRQLTSTALHLPGRLAPWNSNNPQEMTPRGV